MFREFKAVRQEPRGRRRLFEAPEIDLFVWLDEAGVQTGFQLIYRLKDGERALTWRKGSGFSHSRIDSGSAGPFSKQTPILQPDGVIPWSHVEDLFRRYASSLDPDLRDLILARLAARG